ncbi:MAG: OadG family protein [candidate division KSB1 bacterium]|nr:OadG family protein [candidate division KSB1 bacterium]MDZ7295746.1 OadG family protein [candidate division KSB1 bacterium]MDZ7385072.1 OadG family protein [candidate division KSB1 bacterium]MDZ7392610.1 OadG family protein [candidate division KSB1 bacterium]MDZ7414200.1 OadG family protein [candidate division KSB1 bacterium]
MTESHRLLDALVVVGAGVTVVFVGLVLIWFAISLFNWLFSRRTRVAPPQEAPPPSATHQEVPLAHLLAIGTAVELYRRLHLDVPESAVTFERGDERTGWKLGVRYGQRQHPVR